MREGCQAIETERHLFFDCDLAAQLWSHIHRLLDPFFTQKASWVDIFLGARRRLRDEWVPDAAVVHDIWHIIRAVTLTSSGLTGIDVCSMAGGLPRQPLP